MFGMSFLDWHGVAYSALHVKLAGDENVIVILILTLYSLHLAWMAELRQHHLLIRVMFLIYQIILFVCHGGVVAVSSYNHTSVVMTLVDQLILKLWFWDVVFCFYYEAWKLV